MRDKVIDQLKGLGLLLVIINHVNPIISYGHNIIQAFHVPLFFIVSGYLYKKRSIKETAIKKFNHLIIPYLFFLIICIAVDYFGHLLYFHRSTNYPFFQILICRIPIPLNGSIWFLYVLFMCTIIYSMIDNFINNNKFKDILIIVLTISSFLYTRFVPYILPFCLQIIFVSLFFFLIGTKIKTHKKFIELSIVKIIVLLIILLISVYYNNFVNMYSLAFNHEILYIFNSIIGTLICWNILIKLKNNKNIIINKIKLLLEFLSKNAITYICTNQMLNVIFKEIIPISNIIVKDIIVIVLIIVFGAIINYILINSKLRIILGKK